MATSFVLFDLYETLLAFEMKLVHDDRRRMADQLRVSPERLERAEKMTEARMRGLYGGTLDEELATILQTAGAEPGPERVSRYRASQLDAWERATIVHPDVMTCLDDLRRAGVRLGLVSNCSHLTRPLLERWEIGRYFDQLVLSCEVGCTKPDRHILETAVAAMAARAEDGLLVDDQGEYVRAAAAIGLAGWQILRGRPPQTCGHRVIGDLRDLSRELVGDHPG
jgi:HAD superfamily hydrolase (TIGR01509 family)